MPYANHHVRELNTAYYKTLRGEHLSKNFNNQYLSTPPSCCYFLLHIDECITLSNSCHQHT